ncbi:MAG TPA: hypothetical protein VE620_13665 [Myxococcales bacterium]|nr:hypothetical protein [Myxococcales bacterium]
MAVNTEYQGGNGESGKGEVFEHATRMVDEARAFGSALSGSMDDLSRTLDLRGRVERNPIGMVAAALGVGYVLGGGLFSSTTARLLRIGVRLALIPIIKSQISALSGDAGERTPDSGAI